MRDLARILTLVAAIFLGYAVESHAQQGRGFVQDCQYFIE